jgi:multidrug efflux pump subunit AcrA (membrane-fusion protein)
MSKNGVQGMSRKKVIIGLSAIVVIAAVLMIVNIRKGGGDEIQVQTEKVARQQIIQTVNATGRIQPQT